MRGRSALETMFFGPAALTRAVLPQMRERKTGSIVQISSVGGLITAPGFGAYCAAKHALEALSEALASEVAPFGIRVLIVEPGAFRTTYLAPRFAAFRPWTRTRRRSDPRVTTLPNQRLPLGADAVASMRGKLAQVAADIDANESVAVATAL